MIAIIQYFQFLALGTGIITGASFLPQIWRMHQTKSARDISLASYAVWVMIPMINMIHLWFQQDWYLGAGVAIGWLGCIAAFAQAIYYRLQTSKVRSR